MSNDLASWSPASDTTEIARAYRGPAVFDAPTTEIGVPYCKPEPTVPRPGFWAALTRDTPAYRGPIPRREIQARLKAACYLAAATLGAGVCFLVDVTS